MHSRMSSGRPSSIFSRQKRVGDGRPRGADQIEQAALDLGHHGVRRGEAADPDHRLRGQFLDPGDEGLLGRLGGEARGAGIVVPAGKGQIPEVGQFGQEADGVVGLRAFEPDRPTPIIDAEAERHRAGLADRLLGIFQELAGETQPVLERAAVFVAAGIVVPG